MTDTVEIKLFGEVEVLGRRDGVRLKLALSRHTRSLLAWLLLNRESPSIREVVAFRLWSDESKDSALANLRRHLHLLLRGFADLRTGEGVVLADKGTLIWNDGIPFNIDIDEFHRLSQNPNAGSRLVSLYRGELATDLDGDWLLSHRARYQEMFFASCTNSARAAFNSGKYSEALSLLEGALRHDPWREDIIRMALLVRARSGDRAGAFQEFENFRAALAEELGVAPSRALSAAVDSIRRDSLEDPFAHDAMNRRGVGGTEPRKSRVEPKLGSYSFRGRQKELQTLINALTPKGGFKTVAIAVTGESGIGKTRLAQEASHIISQGGIRTHWISCSARFRRPYGAILDLLNMPSMRARWLAADAEVGTLVASMTQGSHITDSPNLFVTSRGDVIIALTKAIAESCENAQALFIVDDAQWLDDASVDVLISTKASASVRILILYRLGCDDASLHLKDLPRIADRVMNLEPLETADVEAIAYEQLQGGSGLDSLVASIAKASRGHPLFAKELALYSLSQSMGTAEELPATISSSIRRRLGEFTAGEMRALQAAAAFGIPFDLEFVGDVSQVARPVLEAAIVKARDRYIVLQDSTTLVRFSHSAFQEALLGTLNGDERARLHGRIAVALSQGPVPNELLAKLALHWREAGDRTNSAIFYRAAGDYARRMYAFHDALDFYERAAALADQERLRLQLLFSRAETTFELGLTNETRSLLDALLERLDSAAEPQQDLRCLALLRISACEWAALRRRASTIWAGRALEEARGSSECKAAYSAALVSLARAAALRGDAIEALQYLDKFSPFDLAGKVSAASYRALAFGMLGQRSNAVAAIDDGLLDSAYDVVDAVTLASALQNSGIVVGWFGDLQGARKYFDRAIAVGRRAMNKMIESVTVTARGYVELYSGDFRLAKSYYESAAALVGDAAGIAKVYVDAFGLRIAASTMDRELAAALVHEQLFVIAEESDDVLFVNTLTGSLIEYAATFDDLPRARALLKHYLGQLKAGCGLWYVFPVILKVADTADLQRAIELMENWQCGEDNPIGAAFGLALSSAMSRGRGEIKKAKDAATFAEGLFSKLGLSPLSAAVASCNAADIRM